MNHIAKAIHAMLGVQVGDTIVSLDDHEVVGGPGQEDDYISAGEHARVLAVHDASVSVKLTDRAQLRSEGYGPYANNVIDLSVSELDHWVDAQRY